MNRYPVWKYAILVIVLLIGALYTLPNFFGEAPAVQVSSAKATIKVDAALQRRVEEALQAAGVSPDSVSFDGNSVRARFDTPDNQLKLNIPSDISFDTGRADIKANLRPILDQFASGLGTQPNTEVRIIGHTDNTGSDATNDPLSMQRAASARDYLTARGVDPQRVMINGRGEREPVADNSTEAGRARNRRVEIYLAERSVASR
mgnify:CR=1 FL=1